MNRALVVILFLLFQGAGSSAYDPNADRVVIAGETPVELEGVGITEKLGGSIDLNLEFVDDLGESVQLKKYFEGDKPVLMAMVYYGCPNLCNFQLNGLTDVMKGLKLKAGEDYEFVAVSINPEEDDLLASEKKAAHIEALGKPDEGEGLALSYRKEENIQKLARQFGFGYKWLENTKEYSHAAASYLMTPKGVISRYLYGVQFNASTLGLSLVEASNSKIGDIVDRIVLFCFQFDPTKSKYTLYAFNIMRVGALLALLALAIFLLPNWLREKRVQKGEG